MPSNLITRSWAKLGGIFQPRSRVAEYEVLPFKTSATELVSGFADNVAAEPTFMESGQQFSHDDGALLVLRPIIRGANIGETAKFRLWECRPMVGIGGTVIQWVKTPLVEFTATAGDRVGASGGPVTNTDRYCDQITIDVDRSLPGTALRVLCARDPETGEPTTPDGQPASLAIDGLGSPRYVLEHGPAPRTEGETTTYLQTTCAVLWL